MDTCTSLSHFIIFIKHSRKCVWEEGKEIGILLLRHLQNIKDLEIANIYIILGGFQIAFTNIIKYSYAEG